MKWHITSRALCLFPTGPNANSKRPKAKTKPTTSWSPDSGQFYISFESLFLIIHIPVFEIRATNLIHASFPSTLTLSHALLLSQPVCRRCHTYPATRSLHRRRSPPTPPPPLHARRRRGSLHPLPAARPTHRRLRLVSPPPSWFLAVAMGHASCAPPLAPCAATAVVPRPPPCATRPCARGSYRRCRRRR